jgi:hypothetical protein
MIARRFFSVRTFLALAVVLGLAASTYGFAAANVVPESGAGDGSKAISGYTVTNVRYTLDTTTPANIKTVQFEIAPTAGAAAPTTVQASLVTGGTFFACTKGSGTTWSCAVTGVTALAANELRVIAAQ